MAKEIILPFSELKGTLDDTPNEPTLEITENGVYNVKGYTYADVNVEGGGGSSDFSTAEKIPVKELGTSTTGEKAVVLDITAANLFAKKDTIVYFTLTDEEWEYLFPEKEAPSNILYFISEVEFDDTDPSDLWYMFGSYLATLYENTAVKLLGGNSPDNYVTLSVSR